MSATMEVWTRVVSAVMTLDDATKNTRSTLDNAMAYLDSALADSADKMALVQDSDVAIKRSQLKELAQQLSRLMHDMIDIVKDDIITLDDALEAFVVDMTRYYKLYQRRSLDAPEQALAQTKQCELMVTEATEAYDTFRCKLEDMAGCFLNLPTSTNASLAPSPPMSPSSPTHPVATAHNVYVPGAVITEEPSSTFVAKCPPPLVPLVHLQLQIRAITDALARLADAAQKPPALATTPLSLPWSRTLTLGSVSSPSSPRSSFTLARPFALLGIGGSRPRSVSSIDDGLVSPSSNTSRSSSISHKMSRGWSKLSDSVKRAASSLSPSS
ncbi:hypothetical protein GGF31_008412 [Allomyces arbusculus]|nr:hypothetical protein GGF31_008412 [Allomyces arbusculus]